jgi:glycosyltransferase involved in cell wall biosynthesis
MKYCVIVPAYFAGKFIDELLDRLLKIVAAGDVLVIDDGSGDDTADRARKSGVKTIVHERNRGKGAALRTGFAVATEMGYDVAVTLDADLQHPPETIPRFIEKIDSGLDFCCGNRMNDTARMPLHRRFSNSLSTFATSVLARKRLADSQCGFRAVRLESVSKMTLFCDRYQIESEMLVEAARLGIKIGFIDIPTVYAGNGSHFGLFADTARFVTFLLLYYPRRLFYTKQCRN